MEPERWKGRGSWRGGSEDGRVGVVGSVRGRAHRGRGWVGSIQICLGDHAII
jgi:hypothetical protein